MDQQASTPKPPTPEEPPDALEAAEAAALDVTGRSLLELFREPGSDLAESVRKLVNEVGVRHATVSSFGSFLS